MVREVIRLQVTFQESCLAKFGISWSMEGILLRSNQIGKARKWIVSATNSQCRLCNTQRTHHGPLSLCNGSWGHAGCGRLARRGCTVLTSIARAHWECMSEYEDRMIQLVYVSSVQLSHILSDFIGTCSIPNSCYMSVQPQQCSFDIPLVSKLQLPLKKEMAATCIYSAGTGHSPQRR